MELIYVFLNGSEWEDIVLFLSEEEAIQQSIDYPNGRVEIFRKKNTSGYEPTYDYYQDGLFIKN